VGPALILDTGRFDFETAKRSQGWKRHLRGGGHDHEARRAAERHGVSSFVFRSDRPFHPERLAAWLEDWDGAIVRAKGVCHVANHEEVIGVSQAGPSVRAGPIGEWRPDDDRRTQLVFIGREMNEERIREDLEACVIDGDETELNDGTEAAADPFPL